MHENAIKFNGIIKCNLMGFSWYWKTNHETYEQIFMVFISWDVNGTQNSWPMKTPSMGHF